MMRRFFSGILALSMLAGGDAAYRQNRPASYSTLTLTSTSADALGVGCVVGSTTCTGGINTGLVKAGAGAVGTPSYTFQGDADTGVYHNAANQVSLSAGGTQAFLATSTSTASLVPLLMANGAVGAPSLAFTSDPTDGMYRLGSHNYAFANNGVATMQLSTSAVQFNLPAIALSNFTASGHVSSVGNINSGGSDLAAITDSSYTGAPPGVQAPYTISGLGTGGVSASTFVRMNPSAALEIGTLTFASNNALVYLINVSGFNITLDNNYTASASAILTSTGADIVMGTGRIVMLWYDSATARWRAAPLF